MLKQYGSGASSSRPDASVHPKGKAKAKAAPKAQADPQTRNASSKAKTTKNSTPKVKIDIGSVSNKGNGKSISDLDLSVNENADGLCEADKTVLDGYHERVTSFKTIMPPEADSAYKCYLTEMCGKISTVLNEVKIKRRSAFRRTLKEQDPLYIGCDAVVNKLQALQHLVKCFQAEP